MRRASDRVGSTDEVLVAARPGWRPRRGAWHRIVGGRCYVGTIGKVIAFRGLGFVRMRFGNVEVSVEMKYLDRREVSP